MATTIRNRSFTAAALALAAGVCGVGASQAKGDIDWSISVNLGYSSGGCYSGWSGYGYSGWSCRPYYPRACYTPCYSPWYGGYYTGGYYISAPTYAFSTPLYMPSGSTFVYSSYSPWGSGFTYTTTTYYTPYSNYYAPAYAWNFWPRTGISINFWDDDDCDDRYHHRNRHDRHHVDHHDRSANFPRSNYSSNLNGKPNTNVSVPAAQTFGTAGPVGYGLPESKGPRSVTPVAAKPIESKPLNTGKPSLDSLTQNRPSSFNGKPVTGPVAPSKFPQTSSGKPVAQAPDAKPATTFPVSKPQTTSGKPVVQAPVSKPSIPTQTAPNKAPSYQSDKGQLATAPQQQPQIWSKPSTGGTPAAKPSTGRPSYRSTVGTAMPSSRNGASTPSAMPAPRASAPSASYTGKPSVSAPAPTPRMSAPSPRASAPAPSAKAPSGPSMPSGGNKMGGGGGGHGKGR